MVFVSIITLLFGINNVEAAQLKENIVYNKNILYINKFNNLVNIKDIINIDILNNNKRLLNKTVYIVNDLSSRSTFLMPAYSNLLNLTSRVDKRVIVSRLANGIKSTETGGATAYYRKSYSSSACGAYQYMPETWNNYMGYKSACLAPAWVQDQRIIAELQASFQKYHSWSKAVAAHLMPSRANDPWTWNKPVPGNPTVQQYVNSVFLKANIALA
jgi:hypothetical protein